MAFENMMRRYFEDKEVLLESDSYSNGIYTGTMGVYKSIKDGVYFWAIYRVNGLSYTGRNFLEKISESTAFNAVENPDDMLEYFRSLNLVG